MKKTFTVLALAATVFSVRAAESAVNPTTEAADIQLHLPEGWNSQLVTEKGEMGSPYGLQEPLFRIDFVNTNEVIHVMHHRPEWLRNTYTEIRRIGDEQREKGETNILKISSLQDKVWRTKDTNEVEVATIHPNLRLYFYGKENRKEILESIDREQIYSFDIPLSFGETKDFVVVRSASGQNTFTAKDGVWGGGDFSEEANRKIEPLLQSLKKYVAEKR